MAHILLIEPDRLLGQTYLKNLEEKGHQVELCGDAQQAIHRMDERPADIIILELQLANHGGVEFLYELRSYPEWQRTPIIIQTLVPPYLFSVHTQQMRDAGITQYLYKPSTTLAQLNRAIEVVLAAVRV